jgi:methionyl aminopeptidase
MQFKQHCESNSYGVVREFVGHGIGKDMHEDPHGSQLW